MATQKSERKTLPFPAQPLSAWDVLAEAIGNPLTSDRPAGSVTAYELAEQRNCSHSHAANILKECVRTGKLKVVPFRAETGKRQNAYIPA
jgi:hypothetical protein